MTLLPLCSLPKLATRDGYGGAFARLLLPFYGYWFASGQIYTFPNSTVPQNAAATLSGTIKPDTFKKDCCSCLGS